MNQQQTDTRAKAPTAALSRVNAQLRREAARGQVQIRAKARDEARRRALCERAAGLTQRVDRALDTTDAQALTHAMAGFLVAFSEGGERPVTEADMLRTGFTRREIESYGDDARTLAFGMAAEGSVQ